MKSPAAAMLPMTWKAVALHRMGRPRRNASAVCAPRIIPTSNILGDGRSWCSGKPCHPAERLGHHAAGWIGRVNPRSTPTVRYKRAHISVIRAVDAGSQDAQHALGM